MSTAPTVLSPTVTVAELAASHPATIAVLERLGIDYCCGGRRPLGEAIAEKGLAWPDVSAELQTATAAPATDDARNWSDAPLSELAGYIVTRYHEKLREDLPRLTTMGQKVLQAHEERHPEVRDVASVFAELRAELESHMMKEEHVLFPFIGRLESGTGTTHPMLGHIASPIAVMEGEHESAAAALAELRAITASFAVPTDACATFRGYYEGLATLERELHGHIHLENNVLFPRAQALEAKVLARA
jgi:regulator of cell morphogenesis and NO signaling